MGACKNCAKYPCGYLTTFNMDKDVGCIEFIDKDVYHGVSSTANTPEVVHVSNMIKHAKKELEENNK